MIRYSETEIDPVQLRVDLETAAMDRLRTGSLALLGWAIVTTTLEVIFFAQVRFQSIGFGAALMAVGLPGLIALRRGRFPTRWVDAYGALLLLMRMAHLGLAYYRTGSMFYPLLLINGMIAAAGIHMRRGWVIACLGVAAAMWVPGLLRNTRSDLALGFTLLGGVSLVSFLFHVFRMRHFLYMHALRTRDRRRGELLAEALVAVERELRDRKRAEEEREGLREQLSHAQKMEAVGTLAGGFAHDINNILVVVMGLAEIVRDASRGQVREDIDQILTSCKRGSELTRNLLGFSRRGQYRIERIDMASVVNEVSRLLSRTIPKSVTLDVELDQGAHVTGDSTQLGQLLMNLCLNSLDAMPQGGHLMVRISRTELEAEKAARAGVPPGLHVALSVADSGCGMDEETRQRMFEPFFTTRRERGGTGLGLAMVYGTTMKHRGGILVESSPGAGTRITVFLPLAEIEEVAAIDAPADPPPAILAAPALQAAPAIPAAPPVEAGPPPRGCILIVDDEAMVRAVVRRTLRRAGYSVIEATDGMDGIDVFERHRDVIDLVLLDMAMPIMGGADCFARLREIDPTTRVILASGFTAEEDAQRCLQSGALCFLEKPYSAATLLTEVARGLDQEPPAARRPTISVAPARPTLSDQGR